MHMSRPKSARQFRWAAFRRDNTMGKHGGITWELQGERRMVVKFWKVIPPEQVDILVQDLYEIDRRHSSAKLPPEFTTNNRSFGKLPPGAHPHWQSREWIGFILWFLVVGAIFAGAIWHNVCFFWR
jgi:hypothetical protein